MGRRRWGASSQLASLIFENPAELAQRFADLLRSYWEAAFAEEWERVEPLLAATITESGWRIAAEGFYEFVRSVSLKLRVNPSQEEFGLDLPHDHRVPLRSTARSSLSRASTSGLMSRSTATSRGR
jgi:hypothetical protein